MCGIAGFIVREPGTIRADVADDLALNLLRAVNPRGGDATGLVAFNLSGDRLWRKASGDVWRFQNEWRALPDGVSVVLLHTRFATQGHEAFPENNHPVRRGPFYVVHNGHVWNDSEVLPDKLRDGNVDSEAIPYLLSVKDNGLTGCAGMLRRLRGDIAVGAVDERHPHSLTIARGRNSPVYVHTNERITAFASTGHALAQAWSRTFGGKLDTLGNPVAEGKVLHYTDGVHTRTETVTDLPQPVYLSTWRDTTPTTPTTPTTTTDPYADTCDGCGTANARKLHPYTDSKLGVDWYLCGNCHEDWTSLDPQDRWTDHDSQTVSRWLSQQDR